MQSARLGAPVARGGRGCRAWRPEASLAEAGARRTPRGGRPTPAPPKRALRQVRESGSQQSPYIEELRKAQEAAQQAGAGLWSKVTPRPGAPRAGRARPLAAAGPP
jgi:endonuclease YncB( thermonuclease family)